MNINHKGNRQLGASAWTLIGSLLVVAGLAGLGVALVGPSSQAPSVAQGDIAVDDEITPMNRTLVRDKDRCLVDPSDPNIAAAVGALAMAVLDQKKACLHSSYSANANPQGSSGAQLRAGKGTSVRSIDAGVIVERAQSQLASASTRVVVRDARYRQVIVYEPLIDVGAALQVGTAVDAGQRLGSVAAGSRAATLNVEVWGPGSHRFELIRLGSVAKQMCAGDRDHMCSEPRLLTVDPLNLMLLAEERAVAAKLPPLPFVEVNPSMSDVYVTPTTPVVLKVGAPLYATKDPLSTPIQLLPQATRLKGLNLHEHTTRFLPYRALVAQTVEFMRAPGQPIKVNLQPGEVIATVAYWGEGECRFLVRGRTLAHACDIDDKTKLQPLGLAYMSEIWLQVQTTDGAKGWLWNPVASGISKHE
jgi:hypothetical protein